MSYLDIFEEVCKGKEYTNIKTLEKDINKALFSLPEEEHKNFAKLSPEARLRWLEDAQEFVRKVVPP